MLGMENEEDSPKRRSTFYVSLDGEARPVTKVSKTLSVDQEKYSCNTFPIGPTKVAPNPHLTRTLSTHDGLTNGVVEKKCEVESRGKVQSLTRIFEASKVDEGPEQRKKVERTRSFKTIERFQSRFIGKKDPGKKDNRLNNTIACIDTENCEVRRKCRDEEVDKRAVPKIKSRTRETRPIVEQRIPKQHNNNNNNNNNNNSTFANLLIRRTHSTKLARSTSALVRPTRHTSTGSADDDSANLEFGGDNEKGIHEDAIGRNECPEGCVFEETDIDGGVHSGE